MNNILKTLVKNSELAINDGIYDTVIEHDMSGIDLVRTIRQTTSAPLISEIKFASPSEGDICRDVDPVNAAKQMIEGGAIALSVLTQPHLFGGSPENLARVRAKINVPILMKDIIIDARQIEAGAKMGADYVLLIESVFKSKDIRDKLINLAHSHGLGVLLEAHTPLEFNSAITAKADMVGINNRNLDTLKIDLATTERIMADPHNYNGPIVTESGISGPGQIRHLRACGADVFLVGTSIMKSSNIKEAVRALVNAI